MVKKLILLSAMLILLSSNYNYGMENNKKNTEYKKFNSAKIKLLKNLAYFDIIVFNENCSYLRIDATKEDSSHIFCNNFDSHFIMPPYKCFIYLIKLHQKERNKNHTAIAFYDENYQHVETLRIEGKEEKTAFYQAFLTKKLIVKKIIDNWKGNSNPTSIFRWKFISPTGKTIIQDLDEGSKEPYKRQTLTEYLKKNQAFLEKKYDLDNEKSRKRSEVCQELLTKTLLKRSHYMQSQDTSYSNFDTITTIEKRGICQDLLRVGEPPYYMLPEHRSYSVFGNF